MIHSAYHIIVSSSNKRYRVIKLGNKRATIAGSGFEIQKYIGWLLMNRNSTIYLHDKNGCVVRVMKSER